MKTTTIGKFVFASSALALAVAAYGQEQRKESFLEEIIITAEKRTENLQDVPVAVSAFTSQTREEIGLVSIQDFTKYTPGLSYSTNLDRITLRGIGRFTNNLAADPGVAVYADNVYTNSTTEAGKDPLFVERTEILRGPQGTLYGRNSIGGAINVISKRPTEDFSAEVRGSYGDYERSAVAALIRGPINDNVRYLVGASTTKQNEGYFTNVGDGPSEGGVVDDQLYQVQLEANFGDFDIWVKYQKSLWDQSRRSLTRPHPYDTDFGINAVGAGTALLPSGALGPTALFNTGFGFLPASVVPPNGLAVALVPAAQPYTESNPGVFNNREFRTNTPFQATLDDNQSYALDMTYHLPGMDLRYTGGYQHYIYVQESDFDETDREFYDYTDPFTFVTARVFTTSIQRYKEDKSWLSHELNLSSSNDSDFQWLVGLYQYREDYSQPLMIYSPDQANLETPCITFNFSTCSGLPTAANPERLYYLAQTDMDKNASQAAYAQFDLAFNEDWSATLGVRYTKDEKSLTETTRLVRWDPTFNGAAPVTDITRLLTANNGVSRGLGDEWGAYTGTLGVQWQMSDDSLAFAKYTRGYKSGGFNSGTIAAVVNVAEERVDAYEFGWKSTFMDNLQVNTALFYYDYQDFQSVVTVVPALGGPLRSDFLNLAKAESMGLEIETNWAVTEGISILFNYSWQQSEIKDIGVDELGNPRYIQDSSDPTAVGSNARRALELVGNVDPVTGDNRWLQDVAGNPLPGSPEHKVAFNVRYTLDFNSGSLIMSLSDTWRSKTNYSLFNDASSTADSFNQVDVRALWRDSQDRYTVIAFVQNILDDEGYDGMIDARADDGALYSSPGLTPPRTYGLELQYRFGG